MRCPDCNSKTKVIDSREASFTERSHPCARGLKDGEVGRMRKCPTCFTRFITKEMLISKHIRNTKGYDAF